jgi:isopentenyl-diphosphate delta-isomerase type 1
MNKKEHVILVNEHDNTIGTAEKLAAHQLGQRHRAFSIFIFYQQGDTQTLLIHQRHPEKYHCGGLWTNTCCSHPRPDESTEAAAHRRLREEIGIDCALHHAGAFHYIAHLENGLTENEYDHVFVGYITEKTLHINPREIIATQWVTLPDLEKDLKQHPEKYTPWLLEALEVVKQYQHSSS